MTRFHLEIDRYMSSVVVLIDPSQTLAEAMRRMRSHEVRHLPVVARGRVIGLLSQRDAYLVQSLAPGVDPTQILVSEAMTRDPYTVDPEQPIDVVAREMARRKIGSVLVTHNDVLLGLFTTTDALLALAAFVEDDRVPGEDDVLQLREETPAPRRAKRKKAGRASGARPAKGKRSR